MSKGANNAEYLEAAHANPKAHTANPNPLSHENHETTRATKKKMARGQGWRDANPRNKLLRQNTPVHVKENSLQSMIMMHYLATKNRF